MQTGLLIFIGLLAFSSAQTVLDPGNPSGPSAETCESGETSGPWGFTNLQFYYFCANGHQIIMECDEDCYFMNDGEQFGCIPAKEIITTACVNSNTVVGACTGINMRRPQYSEILTNFWLCTAENQPPIELPCKANTAFIDKDGYTGCVEWPLWRQLRDCE